jgi:hypothetical protein
VDARALDAGESGLSVRWQIDEFGVGLEHLRQTGGLELGFG